MCGPAAPVIMAGIGIASSIGGTALSMNAQGKAAEASLAQARANAKLAETVAQDAEARGSDEAARTRGQADAIIALQRVRYAASGVDASSGTAAEVMAQTRELATLDAQTLINNAAREAFGLRTHGMQFLAAGAIEGERARQSQYATLLGGIGQAAGYGAKGYEAGSQAGWWGPGASGSTSTTPVTGG